MDWRGWWTGGWSGARQRQAWDLIVTMDDATNEHYSMFVVAEEGTRSSFHGVAEVIRAKGLFCSFYSDRGSHCWLTPTASGKVDKTNLTQFGRTLQQLGIEMIAAYPPEARGRSERAFATHQMRLPKELAYPGITDLAAANRCLARTYRPTFNAGFAVPAREEGSAFVPWIGGNVGEILCEQVERTGGHDNCVRYPNLFLELPADRYHCHYMKAKVRVHHYANGRLAVFHGPRRLADYSADGKLLKAKVKRAA